MIKNYFAPTPKNLRIAGDLCLLLIPAVDLVIKNAPNLSGDTKYWLGSACTIALIVAKFATNLFKEETKN